MLQVRGIAMSFTKISKFFEAYSLYCPLVCSLVFKNINNNSDPEHVAQDIFILCAQKFSEVENLIKWPYATITKYKKFLDNRKVGEQHENSASNI
mgnify:CR=1 FL=1